MVDTKKDEPMKKVEERHPFSPPTHSPAKSDQPLHKDRVDPDHDKTKDFSDHDKGANIPSGLKREAIKPLEERASGESGRKNQTEVNPHKDATDDQPKEREFSGDVRRPGSPDLR